MYNWRVALSMGAGAGLVAFLFAVPSLLPRAMANEEPARTLLSTASELFPEPFDPDKLAKWTYDIDPSLNTEVLRQSTVKKVGYGQTQIVHVLETPSGTYSTDALGSPYVEYPGIAKRRNKDQIGLAFWADGGWIPAKSMTAGSFVTVTKFEGGQLVVTEDGMCLVRPDGIRC